MLKPEKESKMTTRQWVEFTVAMIVVLFLVGLICAFVAPVLTREPWTPR